MHVTEAVRVIDNWGESSSPAGRLTEILLWVVWRGGMIRPDISNPSP